MSRKSKNSDWIPGRESEFVELCGKWKAAFQKAGNMAAFKWDEGDITVVMDAMAAFNDARAAYLADDSTANRITKDNAKKDLKAAMRAFANTSIRYNKNMDAAAKKVMGIEEKDPVRTPVSSPASRALVTDLKPLGGFRVEIRFQDEATPQSRAIPYGCNGCLLNYAYGDERITDYSKLTLSKLMTHTPFTLSLPPEAERKYLSCATRWQNERGELGPWSEIVYTIVA